MGTQIFTPTIIPGSTKETVFNLINTDTTNGDTFVVFFDTEYTLDQIILSLASGSIGTGNFSVSVEYPASADQTALVSNSEASSWQFNIYSTPANPNRWLRLPAGSKLIVLMSSGGTSNPVFRLSIVGR